MNIHNSPARTFINVAITITSMLVFATASYAAGGDRPCADDATKFCKDVKPGGGRIATCLREHSNELSPACKENMSKSKARAKEAKSACLADRQKYCKDVQPGQGRIAQCLKQHEAELSAECKEHLAKPQGRRN